MLPHWGRSLRGHKPATKHQPMDERIWTNTTILMNLNDILMDEWLWILIWREMEWNGARQFVNLYLNLNESEQSGDVLSSGLLCCNSASLTITVRVGQLPACQQLFWFYYACRHIMARQPAVIGPLELPPQIELDGKKKFQLWSKKSDPNPEKGGWPMWPSCTRPSNSNAIWCGELFMTRTQWGSSPRMGVVLLGKCAARDQFLRVKFGYCWANKQSWTMLKWTSANFCPLTFSTSL